MTLRLRIGGLPDPVAGTTRYALEIPGGLSVLAYNDPNAEVVGLDAIPTADRPPVRHLCADFCPDEHPMHCDDETYNA